MATGSSTSSSGGNVQSQHQQQHQQQVAMQQITSSRHIQPFSGVVGGAGSDQLTLNELQEMAARQQHQIEINKQILDSREQRLRHLRSQCQLQASSSSSSSSRGSPAMTNANNNSRFDPSRIAKLKAVKKIINEYRSSHPNGPGCTDLAILQELCAQKERELHVSNEKVEELNGQIEQLRRVKHNRPPGANDHLDHRRSDGTGQSEVERLRQELMIRTRLNEQQSRKISLQKDMYAQKQKELIAIDNRLLDLTERLCWRKFCPPASMNACGMHDSENRLLADKLEELQQHRLQSTPTITSGQSDPVIGPPAFSGSVAMMDYRKQQQPSANPSSISGLPTSGSSMVKSSKSHRSSSSNVIDSINRQSIDDHPSAVVDGPNHHHHHHHHNNHHHLRHDDDKLHMHVNITNSIKKRHSITDSDGSGYTQLPVSLRNRVLEQLANGDVLPVVVDRDNLDDDLRAGSSPPEKLTSAHSGNDGHRDISQLDACSDVSDRLSELTIDQPKGDDGPQTAARDDDNLTAGDNSRAIESGSRRVHFDPIAILLDAAVEGELDLIIDACQQIKDPSQSNDEGITALHNAVCAGKMNCVRYLVDIGSDINAADNDGWTPLHCAASCNSHYIVKYLLENGAAVFARTLNDDELPEDKCEIEEDGYEECFGYLHDIAQRIGVDNEGLVYALYSYEARLTDELTFESNEELHIVRRGDGKEKDWWWAEHKNTGLSGYVPKNYLGMYSRVKQSSTQTRE